MKKATLEKRLQIANDIMYYIYIHIDTDITIDDLSEVTGVSKYHMQRVFKEFFHRTIHDTIKAIRLQKASNLLLTNRYATISEIANLCGYASQSSFIHAFAKRFKMTPTQWKQGGYMHYSSHLLKHVNLEQENTQRYEHLEPVIVKRPLIQSYYIRNSSYERRVIKQSWQKLSAWLLDSEIKNYKQIALFHDNPTITPLHECQYVACVALDDTIQTQRLPHFTIAKGVYAQFDVRLEKGEILYFIRWIYHQWLPNSEFETSTKPSYAIYHENEYLLEADTYAVSFFVPIRF